MTLRPENSVQTGREAGWKLAGEVGHVGQAPNGDGRIPCPQLPQHDLLDLRRAEARAADGLDVWTA